MGQQRSDVENRDDDQERPPGDEKGRSDSSQWRKEQADVVNKARCRLRMTFKISKPVFVEGLRILPVPLRNLPAA